MHKHFNLHMRFFFAIISLFVSTSIYTQNINVVFNEFNFENGLSSNQVLSLAQDDDGFLWIGTANGLNRYDGNSFTQYFASSTQKSIADNHVNALSIMQHHILAIGTASGLSFLNMQTGVFSTFKVPDTTALYFMRNNFQQLCTDKKGNLWASTQTELYIFNLHQQLIKTIPGNYKTADINSKLIQWVWTISQLPDSSIMVNYINGTRIYNAENLKQISTSAQEKLLPGKISENSVVYYAPGVTWFMENNKDSVYQYKTTERSVTAYPLFKDALKHIGWFTKMYAADENTLYIHFADTGFFRLTISKNSYKLEHINNLTPLNDVSTFFKDRQNNLWIATANGLFEWTLYKNQFRTTMFNTNSKSSADVSNFLRADNDLWVATYGNGLYHYNLQNRAFQHYIIQLPNTPLLPMLWSIRRHTQDTLWLATQQGIVWFNVINNRYGRLRYSHPAILDSFPVTEQFTDSKGLVWLGVGGGHGLVCYNPQRSSFVVYNSNSAPAFPLRHPTAIAEDNNGNLWMGTQRGGGLVMWNRTANSFSLIRAGSKNNFNDSRINSLYCDRLNNLYIGTGNAALLKYNITGNRFEDLGKDTWPAHGTILKIDGSLYPDLWLATESGLHVFNTATKSFKSFFKKDGLPVDTYTPGICYDSSTSTMYVGLRDGMSGFDARHLLMNDALPSVIITSVMVNDRLLHTDVSRLLSLNYNENNFTVDFTAVNLTDGADLKFRYRFSNEQSWNDAGKNRQVHFSNLSPGNYTLLIQAANKAGVFSHKMASLNFNIKPPFWNTLWFYALIAIIVVAVVYMFYRFRIQQFERVMEMRNRIAQDLHDDIGGTITAINLTNQLAIQNLDKPVAAKKLLGNISDDLKNVGETLDDIVWAVNPTNDSMEETIARMRRYASRAWEEAGIDFNLDFDVNAASVHLNMEQRRDLYLIFKETVNNVAKHSNCTVAKALFRLKSNSLFLTVTDNGNGFDTTAVTHRNGLKSIQNRTKKWKGECTFESSPGSGTSVIIQLPITQKGD